MQRIVGERVLARDQVPDFRKHAIERSRRLIQVLVMIVVSGTLLLWPLDLLFLQAESITRQTLATIRISVVAVGLVYLWWLSYVPFAQRTVLSTYLTLAALSTGISSMLYSETGGLDAPWFYFGYCTPALSAAILVPLGQRILVTVGLMLVWDVAFFASHPAHFVLPQAPIVLSIQFMMVLCTIALGHGMYLVVQRNWAQREFIRRTFAQYFDADVASVLIDHHAGRTQRAEERLATILFCDLRGYSSVVEQLDPHDVVKVLNAYFSEMHHIIAAHQGTVLDYIGDGILIVFGAPADLPNHPERALGCARAMRARLEELNTTWREDGTAAAWTQVGMDSLSARWGIHTGRVVAGSFGGERFLKYGVIGDVVNVASRLESLNKDLGTSILLSGETRASLPADVQATLIDRGQTPIRGRIAEIAVYEG